MTPDNPRAEVPVTQADRETAADIMDAGGRGWATQPPGRKVRTGHDDNNRLVQASARHRIAALAQPVAGEGDAELVCDRCGVSWHSTDGRCYLCRRGEMKQLARRIASSPDHSALVRDLVEALTLYQQGGCPVCNGDCASANPPVSVCPARLAATALAAAKQAMGASALAAPAQPEMPIEPEIIGTSPELQKRLERMGRGESPGPVAGGVVEDEINWKAEWEAVCSNGVRQGALIERLAKALEIATRDLEGIASAVEGGGVCADYCRKAATSARAAYEEKR